MAVDDVLLGTLRVALLVVLVLLPGGRVGGLLRPPATRVVEEVPAGFAVLDADAAGRRAVAVVPELEAGFFREEAAEAVDFVLGERGAALGASSCWTTSKLSASDMAGDRGTAKDVCVVGQFCRRESGQSGVQEIERGRG